MNRLSNEEIYRKIGNITANFELYKCDECAKAFRRQKAAMLKETHA